jgi:hypothetical protein
MRLSTVACMPRGHFLTAIVVMMLILLSACAPARLLPWKPVDAASLGKTDAFSQKLNTIRFVTVGPEAEQIYAYFLYKDGIEVAVGGGANITNLGRMSISDVMADYERIMRSRQYTRGSSLMIREILSDGAVACYTASDINAELSVWNVTAEGKQQGSVLQAVFADRRGQSSSGTDRSLSGD